MLDTIAICETHKIRYNTATVSGCPLDRFNREESLPHKKIKPKALWDTAKKESAHKKSWNKKKFSYE